MALMFFTTSHHLGDQPPGPVVGPVGHPRHVAGWHRRRGWRAGGVELLERDILLEGRLVSYPPQI